MTQSIEDRLYAIKFDSSIKRHAEHVFFEAMKQGYAADAKKGSLEDMPRSRTIDYRLDEWRVLDLYIVTPAGRGSGGTTTIWYGDVPIWMMQYLGTYKPEALPFLRAALYETYSGHFFAGGRGPHFFVRDDWHYVNIVQENDFFSRANGLERIYGTNGIMFGQHRYQSQWLCE